MELTRDSVRTLLDLQRIDSAIDALIKRRSALPEQLELDRLTAEIEGARKSAAEKELAFGSVSRETIKLETEVSNLEQKISHETTRLYGGDVSSPKELTTIQAEIDALRRRKRTIEDQLLTAMEKRENAEKSLAEAKETLSTLESEVAAATSSRDASSTSIESDLVAYRAEREQVVHTVPEEAREIYDEIRPKREGVAVALLEHGVCRGCMVSLSPFALDAIRRSDDPLIRCENCRRMLVIVD
ncbi:MAG: hypothetical protein NVSMB57_08110 [Actinomycetota bacterium]